MRAVALCALTLLGGCYAEVECRRTDETRVEHHAAWTQLVFVGKVLVPVYHTAHDHTERKFVCAVRELPSGLLRERIVWKEV